MTAMQQMLMSFGSNKLTQRSYSLGYGFDTTAYTATNTTSERGGGFYPESTGQSFLMMFSGTYSQNDTAANMLAGVILKNNSGSALGTIGAILEPKDTADFYSCSGVWPYDGDTASFGKYFDLQYGTTGTNSVTMDSATVLRLTLANNDLYSAPTVAQTVDTTWTDVGTVTVPTTGFYIVVAYSELQSGSISTALTLPRMRVFDGTNAMGQITNGYRKDITNYVPYNHVEVRQFTANTIVRLQIQGDGTNNTIASNASLTLLYIGASTSEPENMPNFYSASSAAQSTTTNTAFQTKASGSFTIANPYNYHILLASAHVSINDTTFSVFSELINTTTSVDYNDIDWVIETPGAPVSGNPQWYTLFLARLVTFSQASNTIAWRYRSENAAATAYIKDANMVLIDTGISSVPALGEFSQGGYYVGSVVVGSITYGILVSPISTQSPSLLAWKTTNTTTAGTTSLVDGLSNSNNMNDVNHPAAKYCLDLSSGGYTDWYLPSRDELNLIYVNRLSLPAGERHELFGYYSSSEFAADSAWRQNFADGTQLFDNAFPKTGASRVRAVRRFIIG